MSRRSRIMEVFGGVILGMCSLFLALYEAYFWISVIADCELLGGHLAEMSEAYKTWETQCAGHTKAVGTGSKLGCLSGAILHVLRWNII